MNLSDDTTLDEPVWEVEAISKILRRTPRQTYHMLQAGHVDASRVGGRWCSTKRRLLKNIIGGRKSAA